MKKLLLLIPFAMQLIAHSSSESLVVKNSIDESFIYGSIGGCSLLTKSAISIPIPFFGLGYRYQHNHVGFDLSADCVPLIIWDTLRLSPTILFYPEPYKTREMYLGFSFGCLMTTVCNVYRPGWTNDVYFLPELVIGYQYKRSSGKNNFVEFRLGVPITGYENDHYDKWECCDSRIHSTPTIIPCASIKFGFSF